MRKVAPTHTICPCGADIWTQPARAASGRGVYCSKKCQDELRGRWDPLVLGETAFIPLNRGEWAMVDASDLSLVRGRTWSVLPHRHTQYAHTGRSGLGPALRMHRVIMGFPTGDPRQVDHVNHNGLDNRRGNLREATASQNAINHRAKGGASQYKGVSRSYKTRWRARITLPSGKRQHLGDFHTEEEAGRAYDAAAVRSWGEYAVLNFPD